MLRFGELAGNDFRLVIFETQTMQERNQSRAAFIDAAKFLLDKAADLARRARRLCCEPSLQDVFLRGARKARTAAHVETDQTLDPARFEEVAPAADGVVVEQEGGGDFAAAPPVIQQHPGVRAPRRPTGRRASACQRDALATTLFAAESRLNRARNRIRPTKKRKDFYPTRGFYPTRQ
jgi:hypothetical protein